MPSSCWKRSSSRDGILLTTTCSRGSLPKPSIQSIAQSMICTIDSPPSRTFLGGHVFGGLPRRTEYSERSVRGTPFVPGVHDVDRGAVPVPTLFYRLSDVDQHVPHLGVCSTAFPLLTPYLTLASLLHQEAHRVRCSSTALNSGTLCPEPWLLV